MLIMIIKNILIFLILSFRILNAKGKQSNDTCSCNLTQNNCDVLCCCDNECSKEDFEVFNCPEKQEETKNGILNSCIKQNILFSSNTPYVITLTGSLFCVEYKEIFLPNAYNLRQEELETKVNEIVPLDFKTGLKFDDTKEYFDTSDLIWTINNKNQIAYLKSPKETDKTPIHYMIDKNYAYLLKHNASLDSLFDKEISAFENLKIISNPKSLLNCSDPIDLYASCENLTSISINCYLEASLDDCKQILNNNPNKLIISSYEILIEYLNPYGIKNLTMNYKFTDKTVLSLDAYSQKFNVKFLQNSTNIVSLSGNPGYIIGKPVIGGLNVSINSSIIEIVPQSLTTFKPSLICTSNSTSREVINFGINSFTECFIEIDDPNVNCATLEQEIKEIALENGLKPDYVATFGNIIISDNINDLIKVEEKEDDTTNCDSISNILSIEIAYAKVGNAVNPQNKIVKVIYRWLKTNINLKVTKRLKVITSVTFVDLSPSVKLEQAKIFKSKGVLPNSFFEPLLSSSTKFTLFYKLYFFIPFLYTF